MYPNCTIAPFGSLMIDGRRISRSALVLLSSGTKSDFGVVKFRNQKSFPVPELNNTEAFTVVHCQE